MFRIAVTTLLALAIGIRPVAGFEDAPASAQIHKAFHLAGIPSLKRDARVDLRFDETRVVVLRKSKAVLDLPFSRIRLVRSLDGSREYPGRTYLAAAATLGMGGQLLMLKKRKVDTFVVDFVNERGGQMGLVLQMPSEDGMRCRQWLKQAGVAMEDVGAAASGQASEKQ